jgi:methionine synthase II (cobalamin-independent)
LTAHDGRDVRRARDFLARDLDAVTEHGAGFAGALKQQVAGPLTLAASLELPNGSPAVSDAGALREIAASLAEGVFAHLAELQGRLPHSRPVLQLDEPRLPAVLAGRIPTPSGYGTVRMVDAAQARQHVTTVLAAAEPGGRAVHCCAPDVPWQLLREAGADAIAVDASLLTAASYDALAESIDAGGQLWLGVVRATQDADGLPGTFDAARAFLQRFARDLGYSTQRLAELLLPTPACGLAGASQRHARAALAILRDLSAWLRDEQAEASAPAG